ncbi:hypothetical protein DAI22_02g151900 [Oryza sativa Japonica Group]|nr:hypothetical protein DAI22_02g151900 [Oryza sativa Japonica Group]
MPHLSVRSQKSTPPLLTPPTSPPAAFPSTSPTPNPTGSAGAPAPSPPPPRPTAPSHGPSPASGTSATVPSPRTGGFPPPFSHPHRQCRCSRCHGSWRPRNGAFPGKQRPTLGG